MSKIQFVIAGCTKIASLHAKAYKNNPDAELRGVFDINHAAAQKFAHEHGISRVYADFNEVLADRDVSAVELLLPHNLHCEYTVKTCMAQKHVSVQKPMALNLQECDRMIQAAHDNGVKLKVSENFIFYPAYRFAKKMLDNGEIGSPLSIRLNMNNTLSASSYMFDNGYHQFSIIMYMLGNVEKVFAWIDQTKTGHGAYNNVPAVVMWKHKDKKLYGIWNIMNSDEMFIQSNYDTRDERMEITGSRGVLWVTRCTTNPDSAPVIMYRDGKITEYGKMKHDWADSFEASTRDFVDAIKHNREPVLSGGHGREALKFALAAVDSSAKRHEVFLDAYEDKPIAKKCNVV